MPAAKDRDVDLTSMSSWQGHMDFSRHPASAMLDACEHNNVDASTTYSIAGTSESQLQGEPWPLVTPPLSIAISQDSGSSAEQS